MNCSKCGAPLTAQDQFCKTCGTPNNVNSQTQGVNMGGSVNNMTVTPMATPVNNVSTMPMTPPVNSVPGVQMAAPVNTIPVQPVKKSAGKGGLYAIICVAILAVAAIIIFVVSLNTGLIGSKTNTKENGNESEDIAVSTYNVNMGNWTFEIPSNLTIEEYDGTLLLADFNDKSWVIRFAPIEGNIKYLNKAGLISQYQAQGITVKNVQKKIDGYDFESFELSMQGETVVMAYADMNGNYVMAVQATKTTGELAYDKLNIITGIMKTASYNVSTNMNTDGINGFGTMPSFNQQ